MGKVVLTTLGILAAASFAAAQVETRPPFVGALSDGLESQVPQGYVECLAEGIFGGTAELCSVGGPHLLLTPGWAYNCVVYARGGDQLAGVRPGGYLRLSFQEPLRRFGAWLASPGAQGTVAVRFYDANGHLMDEKLADLQADCTWYWNGYESVGAPIAAIEFENGVHGGGLLMLDDLEADPGTSPGTSFCLGSINSTGSIASMLAGGTASITAADLVLQAGGLPPHAPGIIFYGPIPAQIPFGTGLLCVTGHLTRLPPGQANPQGTLVRPMVFPSGAQRRQWGAHTGSTWYFQTWAHDPVAGGAGFATSDGLAVTFTP